MLDIHCHRCGRRYLVGTRSIASLAPTPEGMAAHVRCPRGHHLVRTFRQGPLTETTRVATEVEPGAAA